MTSIRSILKPSAPQLVRVPVRLMAGARSASFQCGAAERCAAVVPLAHSSRLVLLETDRTQPRIFSTEGGVDTACSLKSRRRWVPVAIHHDGVGRVETVPATNPFFVMCRESERRNEFR